MIYQTSNHYSKNILQISFDFSKAILVRGFRKEGLFLFLFGKRVKISCTQDREDPQSHRERSFDNLHRRVRVLFPIILI